MSSRVWVAWSGSEGGWDCVVLSWLHVVGVEEGDAEGERVPGNLLLEEKQ